MSTKMEQPFYHDDSFLLGYGHNEAAVLDYKLQKPLTVTEPYRNIKPDLFPSGDVGSLKLASPELERLFIQTTGVMTTPTPGQYIYGRGITDEQEGFVEGFVKALDELHKTNPMPPPNVSIGAGGVTTSSVFNSSQAPEPPIYTTLNETYFQGQQTATINYLPSQISQNLENTHPFQSQGLINQRFAPPKDELQIVPDMHSSDGSPPMSPIDMDSQERIKAERKRLRNRLAATKCRRRKLERIARLEEKVKVLKNDNAGLSNTASVLREQVAQLKQKVLRHMNCGCQLMLTSKMEAF